MPQNKNAAFPEWDYHSRYGTCEKIVKALERQHTHEESDLAHLTRNRKELINTVFSYFTGQEYNEETDIATYLRVAKEIKIGDKNLLEYKGYTEDDFKYSPEIDYLHEDFIDSSVNVTLKEEGALESGPDNSPSKGNELKKCTKEEFLHLYAMEYLQDIADALAETYLSNTKALSEKADIEDLPSISVFNPESGNYDKVDYQASITAFKDNQAANKAKEQKKKSKNGNTQKEKINLKELSKPAEDEKQDTQSAFAVVVTDVPAMIDEIKSLYDSFFKGDNQKIDSAVENLDNAYKNYHENPDENATAFYSEISNTVNIFEKCEYMVSKGLSHHNEDPDKITQLEKAQAARKISSTLRNYEQEIDDKLIKENKNTFFNEDRSMPNYSRSEYNKLDFKGSFAELMYEEDPEKFLMKLTNTQTPEQGLMRLNKLYIAPDSENFTRREFHREVASNANIILKNNNMVSFANEFKLRDVDLFNPDAVKEAVNSFAKQFKEKITTYEGKAFHYEKASLGIPKIDKNTGERQDDFEELKLTPFLNQTAIKQFVSTTDKGRIDRAIRKINLAMRSNNYESAANGSKSDEFKNLFNAVNELHDMDKSSSYEELMNKMDNLIEKSKEYILAKRGQKKIDASISIDDNETNIKMHNKIFHKYGKERYDFAVSIYKDLKELKNTFAKEIEEKTNAKNEEEKHAGEKANLIKSEKKMTSGKRVRFANVPHVTKSQGEDTKGILKDH